MRILWVKANKILPVHSGGDIRSYNIARELGRAHDLTFLSYYGGKPDSQYDTELRQHFPGAVSICTQNPEPHVLDYIKRLLLQAPYAVSRFSSPRVKAALSDWFQGQRFDVAVCDFLDAAVNFPRSLAVPTVLFQHNVESEIWRRHAATQPNPARRVMYRVEFGKMCRYERKMVRKFHHVIAVSEHDRRLMNAWVEASRITVVPTGVDLQQFKPAAQRTSGRPLVIFVGAMDWQPNVDAVGYFCQEIWPAVLAKVPDAKFRVVGRNPDRRVLQLASNSIEVTGRVPSVLEHLHQATVVVVPLRIAGGTRLKIYEAMAAGRAVVSTSVGAEGLDVHDGKDVILADHPASFANSIVGLLQDRELRRRYERAAIESAAQHNWPVIGKKFEDILVRVASRSVASPVQHVATMEA